MLLEFSCVVSCITWTISKSKIFKPLRSWIYLKTLDKNKVPGFVFTLISCPYCLAHWVSLVVSFYIVATGAFFLPFLSIWFSVAFVALLLTWMALAQMLLVGLFWRLVNF